MTSHRLLTTLAAAALATGTLVATAEAPADAAAVGSPQYVEYATPGTYTWTVPAGTTRLTVDAFGAQGGSGLAGMGAGVGGRGAGVVAAHRGDHVGRLLDGVGVARAGAAVRFVAGRCTGGVLPDGVRLRRVLAAAAGGERGQHRGAQQDSQLHVSFPQRELCA